MSFLLAGSSANGEAAPEAASKTTVPTRTSRVGDAGVSDIAAAATTVATADLAGDDAVRAMGGPPAVDDMDGMAVGNTVNGKGLLVDQAIANRLVYTRT